MPVSKPLLERLQVYGTNHRLLYSLAFLFFFLAIYEGVANYVMPLVMVQAGLNFTITGMIIASLSVFGAVFDLLLVKIITNTTYRRLYLLMFSIMMVVPLMLWQSKHVWILILAMAAWGLYFDVRNFGAMDFVGRCTPQKEHASSYGVIYIFKAAGAMLAPLLIGGLVAEGVTYESVYVPYLALIAAVIMFVVVVLLERQTKACKIFVQKPKPQKGQAPIKIQQVLLMLMPGLTLSLAVALIDGGFWSLGSVAAESVEALGPYRGLFLSALFLPGLFMGWFIGSLSNQYGKLNVAAYGLLVGFAFLTVMYLLQAHVVLLLIVLFISGCAQALVYPAIDGWLADFISLVPHLERKTQVICDFVSNSGYVVAPIIVGLLMDMFGPLGAFSSLGVIGVIVVLAYILLTPSIVRKNPPIIKKN